MSNTLGPGQYLGSRKREHGGEGFVAALRRATVPPDLVEEHSHAEAHIVLAIDDSYLTAPSAPAARPLPGRRWPAPAATRW